MNLILLKQSLLLENIWIHISSILEIDLQLPLRNTHLFKLPFLIKKHPQLEHIQKQLIQSISKSLIAIREVFYAFLNKVKEFNITLENRKFSPNALKKLEQYIHNFEVEDLERLIVTHNNLHHWLRTDIVQIQNFLYHYFKNITLNEQTKSQTKLTSLFFRKYFRFNYQLLWSLQDQPAFAAFHNHFTADECLPFIINEHIEYPYFVKLDTITKQAIDYISFNPRLITENNLHDDNRPYRYQQNFQE